MKRLRRSIERSRARRQRLLNSAAGLGLLLASSSAFAQAPKDDISLPPVDVRAQRRGDYRITEPSLFKMPDPIKDTPQTINAVPLEVMRQQGVFSLRDSLRNVSGIAINAGEGGSQGDNLTIRGFNARNDLYLDGVRDWGTYTRDIFNLEALEVLKGPSSAMFGRGSTGGLLNQVSKTPSRTPFYDFSETFGSPYFMRSTVDLNQPLSSSAAVRFNAMVQDSDVAGRNDVHITRYGFAPSATIGLGGPTRFTLSYMYQHEDSVPDDGLPYLFGRPAPVSRSNFYGLVGKDFQVTDDHILTARVDHDVTDDLKIRNTTRAAIYQFDQEATAPRIAGTPTPATPIGSILVNRTQVARDRDDRIFANQTDVVWKFDTGFLKHTLVSGMEVAWETSDVTTFLVNNVPAASLLAPNPGDSFAAVTRAKNTVAATQALTFSLYGVDEIALTEQWKVLGGFRWDRFHADFTSRVLTTGVITDLSRTDSVVSPRAAVLFLPTSAQTYYFAYGTSFNPSAEALNIAVNTVNTPPEQTQSFELGAKWQLLRNTLSFNTALFMIDKTNARTAEPGSLVQTVDGKQRSQGVELEAIGRLLPNWNVWAAYTYLDTEVLRSRNFTNGIPVEGKQLIAAPEHSGTLWTTYDITPDWQIGGGLTYIAARPANDVNTNWLPGYVRGDATAAYKLTKNIELRMNVLNIADTRYFEQVYQGHTVPGAGRTILFSGLFSF